MHSLWRGFARYIADETRGTALVWVTSFFWLSVVPPEWSKRNPGGALLCPPNVEAENQETKNLSDRTYSTQKWEMASRGKYRWQVLAHSPAQKAVGDLEGCVDSTKMCWREDDGGGGKKGFKEEVGTEEELERWGSGGGVQIEDGVK